MNKKIKKVGVIGAGSWVPTIAAQLANVGLETILSTSSSAAFRRRQEEGAYPESKEFRNKLSANAVCRAPLKSKPASFYLPENSKLSRDRNMEDDLKRLKDVQWVIEVGGGEAGISRQIVFEKLRIRDDSRHLHHLQHFGIPPRQCWKAASENFRKPTFAITHFFNPPRYMKLSKSFPGPDTLPEVVDTLG